MPHSAEDTTATLAGPPAKRPHRLLARLMKKFSDARALKERAEDDEHHDVLRAHVDRRRQHAGIAVEQACRRSAECRPCSTALTMVYTTKKPATHRIGRPTLRRHSSASDQHADRADHDVQSCPWRCACSALRRVSALNSIEEERARAQHHQHDIIPGHVSCTLYLALLGRIGQDSRSRSARPGTSDRRTCSMKLANSVTYRQNSENSTATQDTTIFGVPSQMRVLDSRSYLRMIASTSAARAGLREAVDVATDIELFVLLHGLIQSPLNSSVVSICFYSRGLGHAAALVPIAL